MRKCFLISCLGLIFAPVFAAYGKDVVKCGEKNYVVEKSFLSSKVLQVVDAVKTPFCVSDESSALKKTLSFKDQEIWCVTVHHLSSKSRPLAKDLWILNKLTQKLYYYDYLFIDGDWLLQDEKQEFCEVSKDP